MRKISIRGCFLRGPYLANRLSSQNDDVERQVYLIFLFGVGENEARATLMSSSFVFMS